MLHPIISFEQDDLGDWVAILACGHHQHVRHNPPLVERPWVLTAEGRARFIGVVVECRRCEEEREAGSQGSRGDEEMRSGGDS